MQYSDTQRQAVLHDRGPALVLAGPGAGKTFVITGRIHHLIHQCGVDPASIAVITFTKAAAGEMKDRFFALEGRKLPVTFGTFHSVFFGILRHAYGFDHRAILTEEEKQQLLGSLVRKRYPGREDEVMELTAKVAAEISLQKNSMIEAAYYHPINCTGEDFAWFVNQYDTAKKRRRKLDFDDLLTRTKELFENYPQYLKLWQEKFQYILIDEFQDINQLQYEIITALAAPRDNLFAVGDDDQSIYGFRGSKPEIMLDFYRRYPTAAKLVLRENYRSTKAILSAAQAVIRHNSRRYEKELTAVGADGEAIKLHIFKRTQTQNDFFLREILERRKAGLPLSEMAFLYRSHTDAGILAARLLEYNIPFTIRDGVANLYQHWIAKDICAYLKLAVGQGGSTDFVRIMNRPLRYISRDALGRGGFSWQSLHDFYQDKNWMQERLDEMEEDIYYLGKQQPAAAIRYLGNEIGYLTFLDEYATQRGIRYEELVDIFASVQESAEEFETIEAWFSHIEHYSEQLKQQQQEQPTDAVVLSTLHGAKGLEFDAVYLFSLNEGMIPHKKATLPDEIEEERRLLYVGMTRARHSLHLCTLQYRYDKKLEASRFLAELPR